MTAIESRVNSEPRNSGHMSVGHPVDIATGEFFGDHSDLELDGVIPLTLRRRYSTSFLKESLLEPVVKDNVVAPFGPGWRADWQWELRQTLDGFIVVDGKGTEYRFRDSRDPSAEFYSVGRLTSSKDAVELIRVDRWRIRFVRFGLQREPISHVFAWSDAARAYFLERIERTREARVDVRYDERGRVVGLFQTVGQRLLRLYWEGDRVGQAVLVLPNGSQRLVANYIYDRAVLTEVHDRNGLAERFAYDGEMRLTRIDYRSGASHIARYDRKGRCIYVAGSDRYDEKTLHYEDHTRTTRVVDSHGAATKYFCNKYGQVLTQTSPLGTIRRFEFDEYGRPTATHAPTGAAVRTEYDELGRTRQVLLATGGTRMFTHDEHHRVTSYTDELGACTHFQYDEDHNIVQVTLTNGAKWIYRWTPSGRCSGVRNPLGHERFWHFDAWGNVENDSDWRGNVWTNTFDALGQRLTRTDPLGHTTHFVYNDSNELVRLIDPDGQSWERYSDPAKRETTYLRPDGKRSTIHYSSCGLPVEVIDAEGRRTRYDWDTEPKRLLRVTDANGNVYLLDYDAEGNLARRRTFDGRTIIHRWEKGLLRETVDGAGDPIHWHYDDIGRPIERRSRDGKTEYSYDVAGNLARVDNNGILTEFQYDLVGNCVREVQDGVVLERDYDTCGNATALLAPAYNDETRYLFDANGECVGLERKMLRIGLTRDAVGREIKRHLPGVGIYEQTYDPSGRLLRQALVGEKHAPNIDLEREIKHDSCGAIQTIRDSLRGATDFLHDATDVLLGIFHSDGSGEVYSHDAVGNRTRRVRSSHARQLVDSQARYGLPGDAERLGESLETATFERNRVLRVTAQDRVTEYKYDEAGRTVARTVRTTENIATTRFTWNGRGELSSVTLPDGKLWKYRYDGLGRRVQKIRPDGTTERFIWDGYRIVYHIVGEERPTILSYLPKSMCPISSENGSIHYFVPDTTGSPAEIFSKNSQLEHVIKKGTWGENFDGGRANQPAYGQWFDSETGLHYNVFRYYDPDLGRFLSADPIGLVGGVNAYVGVPSPIMYVDALGLTGEQSGCMGVGEMYAAHVQGSAGLIADLDEHGFLNLYIKVGPGTPRGSEMFHEALAAFGPNVKGVRGTWLGGGDIADNFNSFKAAIAAGHTEEGAAFHTFTGKMAQRSGFTQSKVTTHNERKVVVEFTRE